MARELMIIVPTVEVRDQPIMDYSPSRMMTWRGSGHLSLYHDIRRVYSLRSNNNVQAFVLAWYWAFVNGRRLPSMSSFGILPADFWPGPVGQHRVWVEAALGRMVAAYRRLYVVKLRQHGIKMPEAIEYMRMNMPMNDLHQKREARLYVLRKIMRRQPGSLVTEQRYFHLLDGTSIRVR